MDRSKRGRETPGVGYFAYKGYAWYGIRHAVFTALVNKAEIHGMKLDKWGGWRTGYTSGAGMVNIYHAPGYGEMEQIDQEILSKHPFLSFWNNTDRINDNECAISDS